MLPSDSGKLVWWSPAGEKLCEFTVRSADYIVRLDWSVSNHALWMCGFGTLSYLQVKGNDKGRLCSPLLPFLPLLPSYFTLPPIPLFLLLPPSSLSSSLLTHQRLGWSYHCHCAGPDSGVAQLPFGHPTGELCCPGCVRGRTVKSSV